MTGRSSAAAPGGRGDGQGSNGSTFVGEGETNTVLGGRYELGGLIAEGGMAQVFRGRDRRLDRPVAIKLLRPHHAASAEWRARFYEEARAAASLAHPHLVQVFDADDDVAADWGVEAGVRPYIVMELLPGRTLKDVIASAGGQLPLRDAASLARQVALGMASAHRRGLVHRDLKPQNVLIAEDGSAKVGDFGLARAMGGAQLTLPGTVWGTVQYLSPEQAEGRPADARSDVYALGCILYELLTGSPPYEAETPAALLLKHVAAPVPRLRDQRPSLPLTAEAVVARALAKSPDERFQSMDDLAEALACFAAREGGAEVLARPVTRDGRVTAPATVGTRAVAVSTPDAETVTLWAPPRAHAAGIRPTAAPAVHRRRRSAGATVLRAAGPMGFAAAVAFVVVISAVQVLGADWWAAAGAPLWAAVTSVPETVAPASTGQVAPTVDGVATPSPPAVISPSASPAPRALGAFARLDGWSVTVSRYEWHTACPGGRGRLAPGTKFVTIWIVGRNDVPAAQGIPALQWTLAGHPAGTGAPPCQPDGEALRSACAPGAALAAGARCTGWLAFEVPAAVEVRGAQVEARAGATEAASWRLR